jgi:hypothetical protein
VGRVFDVWLHRSFLPNPNAILKMAKYDLAAIKSLPLLFSRVRKQIKTKKSQNCPTVARAVMECSIEVEVEVIAAALVSIIAAAHIERQVEQIFERAIALRSVDLLLPCGCVGGLWLCSQIG